MLTWEEISGLLCFSPKLWLSNPAGCQQGSTAFQSGASNSEKLILNRDTLHLPAGHFAGKCYLDSTWLPGLPGLGRRWSVAPCPTSRSPRARPGSRLPSLPGSPHKAWSSPAPQQSGMLHAWVSNVCFSPCLELGTGRGEERVPHPFSLWNRRRHVTESLKVRIFRSPHLQSAALSPHRAQVSRRHIHTYSTGWRVRKGVGHRRAERRLLWP